MDLQFILIHLASISTFFFGFFPSMNNVIMRLSLKNDKTECWSEGLNSHCTFWVRSRPVCPAGFFFFNISLNSEIIILTLEKDKTMHRVGGAIR